MASILESVLSYLADVVVEELKMLLSVPEEIGRLRTKLEYFRGIQDDFERKRITDQHVQALVADLNNAMYDVTDMLDDWQLLAMDRASLLSYLRNSSFTHDVGRRMKDVNERLQGIMDRSRSFNFLVHNSQVRDSIWAATRSGMTAAGLVRSDLVGEKIKQDTEMLARKLIEADQGETSHATTANDRNIVFAIVGVGGIGKTTLAQNIFAQEIIKAEFKTIWLSVNKDYNAAELWRNAIIALAEPDDRRNYQESSLLQQTLTDAFNRRRILLVMDDVWTAEAWNEVFRAPLLNGAAADSRVLVTTRDRDVARRLKGVKHTHHVEKLEPEDAWSLFKKQVGGDEDSIERLKDIGLMIVEKCGHLPLAIKVMAGILLGKYLPREWNDALSQLSRPQHELPEGLDKVVQLSYDVLRPELKRCFLYYSIIPKIRKVTADAIIGMWIADGLVDRSSNDPEKLGRQYYDELTRRNLIEPNRMYFPAGQVCEMHDVVRLFALHAAKDESMVVYNGQNEDFICAPNSHKFRRLFIDAELDLRVLEGQEKLRTLIIFGRLNLHHEDSLKYFPRLRCLHISSENCAPLVDSVCELKHLRYLSFSNTDISRLPDGIGNMKLLQHMSIKNCRNLVQLPSTIVDLGELRYLHLAGQNLNAIPKGFSRLTSLRKLHYFPARMDGEAWCSLEELGPLTQLMALTLIDLVKVSSSSFAQSAKLGTKQHLTYLDMHCDAATPVEEISEEIQKRTDEVFDVLRPPSGLEFLCIEVYLGRRLPNWLMSAEATYLNNLTTLFLEKLCYCTQLPDGLCQLPSLQKTQIRNAPAIRRVGPEFLLPHRRPPSDRPTRAFPMLNWINIDRMLEWEEWEWEEQVQAMSALQRLRIKSCRLRRLPPGLACHARALKELILDDLQNLNSLENFASVEVLVVVSNHGLERIANLPKLQMLTIKDCPRLTALEGMPSSQSPILRVELEDRNMETLPGYLAAVSARYLQIRCSSGLLDSIRAAEWRKFSHIDRVEAYDERGCFMYRKDT